MGFSAREKKFRKFLTSIPVLDWVLETCSALYDSPALLKVLLKLAKKCSQDESHDHTCVFYWKRMRFCLGVDMTTKKPWLAVETPKQYLVSDCPLSMDEFYSSYLPEKRSLGF